MIVKGKLPPKQFSKIFTIPLANANNTEELA
jgi:hypothetical protein